MKEKNIRVQNKQVQYAVLGEGDPLVLIHGFAEDRDVWRYQLEDLSKNYRLILPDLPGSGQSGMLQDMSIEGMAACVHQIIQQELAEAATVAKSAHEVIVIGHSMGGYITLALAEKHPELLKAIGLFHSTAFADSSEKKTTRRRSIEFMQTHGSYEFINQSTPNLFTDDFRIKNSGIVTDMIQRYGNFDTAALVAWYEAMINRPDRTEVLRSFNKPILFIIGKQDKAIPFEDSMKQCHLPQLASVQILEKAAHMGMWEETAKANQALLSFLQYTRQV